MQSITATRPHVGIIMDGNGRWATAKGLSRSRGHEAGVRAIRPVVEAAAEAGVGTLTLYAFSSDNWKRPKAEVSVLMGLLRRYVEDEMSSLRRSGVRVELVGRRDRLPFGLAGRIERAEKENCGEERLHLRIAFDYSARDSILAAARKATAETDRSDFGRMVAGGAGDVDLVIRTGGEKRLSDFMLWECAYAELLFVDRMWPDFGADDLRSALSDLAFRQRRFGGLAADSVAA
jgi:undecaprenyl diphosphate synthase